MIKFLGHTMEWIDDKYYFDGEYQGDIDYAADEPYVFAPRECGESCLMIGPNKPNYGTYLEQASFLKNVYILMQTDSPDDFYEFLKRRIHNRDTLLRCEKLLHENPKLKQGVMKCFLAELTKYHDQGLDVSSEYHMYINGQFNLKLLETFLLRKALVDEQTKEQVPCDEQILCTANLVKKKQLYQHLRRG